MRRVFLVGYMGAGKTTLGREVAAKLGLAFIDLDHYIENRYHKTINVLFDEHGEAGFRALESKILKEVGLFEDVLISTGGGTPCFFDNLDYMNEHGVAVYLKTSPDVLFSRLRIAKANRPILKDKTDEELISFIAENLLKREPFYLRSRLIFDADQLDSRSQLNTAVEKLAGLLLND